MNWCGSPLPSSHLPVMVHNSRRQSSRLLMTANVLCSSSGLSKNGNIAAPINEYSTTKTHSPGVENKMRNVKCMQRFVWITFTVSSASTISPSLFSICDMTALSYVFDDDNNDAIFFSYVIHSHKHTSLRLKTDIDWARLKSTVLVPVSF